MKLSDIFFIVALYDSIKKIQKKPKTSFCRRKWKWHCANVVNVDTIKWYPIYLKTNETNRQQGLYSFLLSQLVFARHRASFVFPNQHFTNFHVASIGNGKQKMQISGCHIFCQKTFKRKNEKTLNLHQTLFYTSGHVVDNLIKFWNVSRPLHYYFVWPQCRGFSNVCM